WPRHVAALPFLWGVVRSIAWEWKSELPEHAPEAADPDGEERRAIAGLDVAKILGLFDDDPVAQAIVRGMMEGARGQELQDLSGLDKTDYETKRTKIRRRLEKLPPRCTDMTRTPDHLDHLADALSEDIIAAPAEQLVAEAAEDAGDADVFVAAFDRVAMRATRQARRRQLAQRVRDVVSGLAPRRSWRPALAVA